MARRKLGDQLKAFVREKAAEINEVAAAKIVNELKNEGPYWTGSFEQSWEVKSGKTDIPAIYDSLPKTPRPQPREISPANVPRENRRNPRGYTIGNASKHRAIAFDAPGTDRNAAGNTLNYVPKGWFNRFVEGGPMVLVLGAAVDEVARKSK